MKSNVTIYFDIKDIKRNTESRLEIQKYQTEKSRERKKEKLLTYYNLA